MEAAVISTLTIYEVCHGWRCYMLIYQAESRGDVGQRCQRATIISASLERHQGTHPYALETISESAEPEVKFMFKNKITSIFPSSDESRRSQTHQGVNSPSNCARVEALQLSVTSFKLGSGTYADVYKGYLPQKHGVVQSFFSFPKKNFP